MQDMQRASAEEFLVPGNSAYITDARERVLDFLRERGIGGEDEIDILLALQEALANATVHGCRNDPSKHVHCTVEIDPAAVRIVVRDPGDGFEDCCDGMAAERGANLSPHGRGILLMRSLMDEVRYADHGSELHLTKQRHVSSRGAA